MLLELDVKNLVLIDQIRMDFGDGLNVLSGETGAGKSILLDAIGLVMGNRAETSLIKQGCESLSVTATFDNCLKNKALCELCNDYELENDDEIIIKRTLNKDGRGKIFFNDQPISQKLLKELSANLIEINGQFASHGLLCSKNHTVFLDDWGECLENISAVRIAYHDYKNKQKEFETAEREWQKIKEDEELITHFADELNKLAPKHGEEEILQQKHKEMMNAEKIAENFSYAYQVLVAKGDVCGAIRQAQGYIDRANRLLEDKYAGIAEMLENALENASAAMAEIEDTAQSMNFSADEQSRIEERLFALKAAARKHNVLIEELPELLQKFENQLKNIQNDGDNLNLLKKAANAARLEFLQKAKELSQLRHQAAEKFATNVMTELAPLKMDKAKFAVKIEELPEDLWNENGIDAVEFCVATNPNLPLCGIDKVASGGELSRLMLAIKVVLAGNNDVATMIFDEIDSGVGGATAEAVGERLANLSKNVQILVVTHAPQVAAKSNRHFKVEKTVDLLSATTSVKLLSEREKTEEIARMISGENISEEARAAAKVLING